MIAAIGLLYLDEESAFWYVQYIKGIHVAHPL